MLVAGIEWSVGLAKLASAGAFGGLVTWVGTEITRRLTTAREKREHTARALAELLEIRNYVSVVKIIKEEMEAAVGAPIPHLMPAIHTILPQFVTIDWAGLATRYNAAVNALAGLQPVLAYQLRSKDIIVPFMQRFGASALQDAEIANASAFLDQLISTYGLQALTDSVLMLARKHAWVTWRETKKVLKGQNQIPPELRTALTEFVKQAKAHQPEVSPEKGQGAGG